MGLMQPDAILDLRGEVCPVPAMYASAKLSQMKPGEVLEVVVDHFCAVDGVPAAMVQGGHKVVATENADNGVYRIRIEVDGGRRSA